MLDISVIDNEKYRRSKIPLLNYKGLWWKHCG